MARSMILGTFLVERRTGRLIATDARAAEQFGVFPDYNTSHDAETNETDHDVSTADGHNIQCLKTLLPDIPTQRWTALLDQNDKQDHSLCTLIRQRDGSQQLARVNFLPLTGAPEPLLLVTVEPSTTNLSASLHRDALTGLPDRRELAACFQRWRQTAEGRRKSLALLFMDLDNFKRINDQYGHTAGDQILVTLASRWQKCLRGDDIVVRYGGDEFVVLLAGIKGRADVEPVLARLKRATANPVAIGQAQVSMEITIGVALSDAPLRSLEQLIDAADADMYASKRTPEDS